MKKVFVIKKSVCHGNIILINHVMQLRYIDISNKTRSS